ncbi:MAG: retropepsin-like aspartic protease [Gammaproteobacteria bacterium]
MRFALALVAVTLVGCATSLHPQQALVTDTFTRDQYGRFLLNVSVNGRTARPFVVDSAASISAVFESARDSLKLKPMGLTTIVHGIAASRERGIYAVRKAEFAGHALDLQRVVVLPDPGSHANLPVRPAGILGQDVLTRYRILFQRDGSVVAFFPAADAPAQIVGWDALPLIRGTTNRASRAVFFLPVDIEGHKANAIFDLGSGNNVVNWQVARSAGLSVGDFPRQRQNALEGIHDNTDALPRFVAGDIRTQDTVWYEEVFVIADLPIFATLGLSGQPAALLGARLFSQRDFVLDLQRERILLKSHEEDRR